MAQVRCDSVSEGLRPSEASVAIRDYDGQRHWIRVEFDFLSKIDGHWYLSMGLVGIDPRTKALLLEFPHEPDSGFNRIWVKPEMLDRSLETIT